MGQIGKLLAQALTQKEHTFKIITSNDGRRNEIEALGTQAGIGQLYDAYFLTDTFTSPDTVYRMQPPANYFDRNPYPRLYGLLSPMAIQTPFLV